MQMGYDFEQDWQPAGATADFRGRFAGVLTEPFAPEAHREGVLAVGAAAPGAHPDWLALRARFSAIHALRHALAQDRKDVLRTGSFVAAGESVLSSCQNNSAVNPVYWANSKEPCAITASVAVLPQAATED